MAVISEYISRSINYLQTIHFSDVIDILIVAFLLYEALGLIIKTNSSRVARGIAFVLVALWASGPGLLNLTMVNMILRKTVELGLIAIVIIFQPELRRVLERVGSSRITDVFSKESVPLAIETAITQTVLACADMSKTKTGALIIFERANRLNDPMSTGTIIGADTTAELLRNIFYPKAPLHDGAAIIRDGRIVAAGCMLPLSHNINLSRDLGMRHRAGIGMSEHSDAVVVIVSEETGAISVAIDGMLKRHLNSDTFEKILRSELIPEEDAGNRNLLARIAGYFGSLRVRKNEK